MTLWSSITHCLLRALSPSFKCWMFNLILWTGAQGTSWLCLCAVCGLLWCFGGSVSHERSDFCWARDKCSCCLRVQKKAWGYAPEDQAKVGLPFILDLDFLWYECTWSLRALTWCLFLHVVSCAEVVVRDMVDEDRLVTVSVDPNAVIVANLPLKFISLFGFALVLLAFTLSSLRLFICFFM